MIFINPAFNDLIGSVLLYSKEILFIFFNTSEGQVKQKMDKIYS